MFFIRAFSNTTVKTQPQQPQPAKLKSTTDGSGGVDIANGGRVYHQNPQHQKPHQYQNKYIRRKSSPLPDVAAMKRDSAAVRRQSLAHLGAAAAVCKPPPTIYQCRTSLAGRSGGSGSRWPSWITGQPLLLQQPPTSSNIKTELCSGQRSRSMVNFKELKYQKKSRSVIDILSKVVEV